MVQGLFKRRKSRRLAEVEVAGNTFEAYVSNGIDMDFLKNGAICFLREAENENRRSPANCATNRTVLRSKTDAERSERTGFINFHE